MKRGDRKPYAPKDSHEVPARVVASQRPDKQVVVSFGAYPDELDRWKAAAQELERPLSWWIRNRLLTAEALINNPENVSLAKGS